jgi:hypothetical protein
MRDEKEYLNIDDIEKEKVKNPLFFSLTVF